MLGFTNRSSKCLIAILAVSLFLTSNVALGQSVGGLNQIGAGIRAAEVGIAIGAIVAIAIVVYLVVPKQTVIEGCVQSHDGGLQLKSDQHHYIYTLVPDKFSLQAGQRVSLKGKKGKKLSGTREFEVRKIVKEEGTCTNNSQAPLPGATSH